MEGLEKLEEVYLNPNDIFILYYCLLTVLITWFTSNAKLTGLITEAYSTKITNIGFI